MMSKVEYVRLSKLISEKPKNGLYKGKEFQGKGSRWIKMNEIYGNNFFLDQKTELLYVTESEVERFNCQAGDLLFGRTSLTLEGIGDCLLVGDVDDVPIFESNLFRIRFVTEQAYPLFYYYFFKSKAGKLLIQTIAKQTAATSITSADLVTLPVPYYPLDIQNKIADQIYLLDQKIQLNRQTNQTLEKIAQAIFKSWFVDFDPTRAKAQVRASVAEGRTPGSDQNLPEGFSKEDEERLVELAAMAAIAGKPIDQLNTLSNKQLEKLKTTAALFPDKLVESELGEIPEGWGVKPLSKMVELIGGGTPKKSEDAYWNGDIPWFSVKDAPVDGDVFVIDTEAKITEVGLNKSSTKLLPEGVTIISARGTVGRLALVGIPTAMNQSCYGVKGAGGVGAYLNYFNLKEAVSTLQQNTHGAVFDTITRDTFDTVVLVDASEELQKAFEKLVTATFEKIKNNLFETKSLAQLRDTLLPKLLSGELQVNEIEV